MFKVTIEDPKLANIVPLVLECRPESICDYIDFFYGTRASSVVGKEIREKLVADEANEAKVLQHAALDKLIQAVAAQGLDVSSLLRQKATLGTHAPAPAIPVASAVPDIASAAPVPNLIDVDSPAPPGASASRGPVETVSALLGFANKRQKHS
ncbi:hypothetical protein CYMTET_5054 [Cymbomonas tetramitiformis]|uniref:Uncharacterized protein n=1 Tax=Cymbomonas tetramitiformis TaxID=36881 RepID=A0AAE0H062_9CHLO|nr:hypothetical protein CYMTET_45431 [Cymbomonas tetramitiformis]KAK3287438.1 hypothetical protein CYMTET_5054 [Cymbomonas tetramitiformis]